MCAKTLAAFALAVILGIDLSLTQSQELAFSDAPTRLPAIEQDYGPAAEVAMLPEAGKSSADTKATAAVGEDLKRFAWRKGDFTVTPYGTLWASMAYETERSRITDYCIYVESPEVQGEPAFGVDCKSTRLGFDVAGPTIGAFSDATVGGKVEIDFQAPFSVRNRGELMLRHCYVEIKNSEYRLLAGQTWDVNSPLAPPTINYPAGSAVGNLAYRRTQFRGERFLAFSDENLLTLQGALATSVIYDFVGDSQINADQGPFPDIQGRAAWTFGERKGPDATPVTIGVSGHIGEHDYDFRRTGVTHLARPTWSFCGDFTVPFSTRFGFLGEFFTGQNVSGYMGGVMQGVNAVNYNTIGATGGWGALWFQATQPMRFNTGYCIDDPWDQDLASIGRTYNEVLFTNCSYDWSKNLNTTFEVSHWKTGWVGMRPGDSVRFDFAVRYKF